MQIRCSNSLSFVCSQTPNFAVPPPQGPPPGMPPMDFSLPPPSGPLPPPQSVVPSIAHIGPPPQGILEIVVQ